MDGFLLLDKPSGLKSSEIAVIVGNVLKTKAGHTGTLDTNATGVMLIGFGKALKNIKKLMDLDKRYEGTIKLHANKKIEDVRKATKRFVGINKQLPPKKSAVSRKERTRELYSIKVFPLDNRTVGFYIHCESGFYVRRLADDLGRALNTRAQLWNLRRTAIGSFRIEECCSVQDFRKNPLSCIISISDVMKRAKT